MKAADTRSLADAFVAIGLRPGDIVYLSTQLYGIGPLTDAPSKPAFLAAMNAALRSVITDSGTLVVPTFTQQVGRFGLPFVLEQTESLTGIFGEYVRTGLDGVRSLHPVFSVYAVGPRARELCDDISPVAFGADSSFDRLVRLGAKAVCIGFDYYSGHIVSLMHHVETVFAVPYYYNKLVTAPVYAGGVQVERPFVINVKYLAAECQFDYRKYIDVLASQEVIRSAEIGRGQVHAVDARVMFDTGIAMLKQDPYAFLAQPPRFRPGEIPLDGPPEGPRDAANWSGFILGS
jgi:aminoglycoside 3-N-acetyltransferase